MKASRLSQYPKTFRTTTRLHRTELGRLPKFPALSQPAPLRRRRCAVAKVAASQAGYQSDDPYLKSSLLPAGKKQARVQLPALFLSVSSSQVAAKLDQIGAAVAGGATAVVLTESAEGGAAQMYEAAIAIKEVLRGRATLLVADRTDIANAAQAEGVLLSSAGLPTVVAKNMLQDTTSLVGRAVEAAADAVQAAADGASFIVLSSAAGGAVASPETVQAAQKQRSRASVPLVLSVDASASDTLSSSVSKSISAGANGLLVSLDELSKLGAAMVGSPEAMSSTDAAAVLIQSLGGPLSSSDVVSSVSDLESDSEGIAPVTQLSQLLSAGREEVVNAEKEVLGRLYAFLESSCPALEEVSLLRDAIVQLDELFLLVIVGEFNSGKSAVINALLGSRVLAEGFLPTTNEISVLKWADPEDPRGERTEQTADGLFVRYINADMLREINVVDTPGTNVILDRQQRLTEEFVPRSDLVLFVMSADRPFTESEVRFLRYIRQWGKKVVFVLNKVDLLSNEDEVKEVTTFVADNVERLLGVEGAKVVPVSAKLATQAKLACRVAEHDNTTDALTLVEQRRLVKDPRWHDSRFEGLETFVRDFLLGGGEGADEAGESVRLKLRTPLFVAEALLEAAREALEAEAEVALADAASVKLVRSQISNFQKEMNKEGQVQRDEVERRLLAIAKRAAAVVDATLTLSNWDALSSYILGTKSKGGLPPVAALFRQEVPKDSAAAVAALVKEHSSWVVSNCQRQVDNYRGFAAERLASLGRSFDELEAVEADELRRDPEARKRWRQLRATVAQAASSVDQEESSSGAEKSSALALANSFDPSNTEALLETDVRDAVLSTATTAAGAGAFGVLLTSVLPTTLEDLLALALSAAVAYASVLNLPLRRAETKKKAENVAEEAASAVQARMEEELQAGLQQCEAEVMSFIEPLEELTMEAAKRAEESVEQLKALAAEVEELQRRVANVE